jgi:hypothetical protein
MTAELDREAPLAIVDSRQLNTVRWGPIRQMFPAFVENIELGRYLKDLLATAECHGVQLRPQRDASGNPSTHVFDVVRVYDTAQSG